MHTKKEDGNSKKLAVLAVMGSLLLSLTTLATAESDAVRAIYLSAANVPTNIAGVNTYPDPPKGFNPLTASDEELATYGFPQRPDQQAEPDHYRMWERAMIAARIRWHGELKTRELPNRAMSLPARAHRAEAVQPLVATSVSNVEASGVILNSGAGKWGSASFADIWSVINVPVVTQPFANGSCGSDWYYSMSLVGIDGYVFFSPATGNPLFEPGETTGVEEAFYCYTGGPSFYAAVFGWGTALNEAFGLNPGDSFYTEIHAFGGCNSGSAFIEDLRTLTYNSYTISNACFPPQTGRYANWVVFRPPFGNGGQIDGLSPLANTINVSFDGAEVLNLAGKPFYPGSQATSTQVLSMTDDGRTQNIERSIRAAAAIKACTRSSSKPPAAPTSAAALRNKTCCVGRALEPERPSARKARRSQRERPPQSARVQEMRCQGGGGILPVLLASQTTFHGPTILPSPEPLSHSNICTYRKIYIL